MAGAANCARSATFYAINSSISRGVDSMPSYSAMGRMQTRHWLPSAILARAIRRRSSGRSRCFAGAAWLRPRRRGANSMNAQTGIVHLVGAGPGAPDLLTVRAARLLARADIVFYDALVHPETLALAERAEKIAVGKRCGKHSTLQHFINKRLIDAAHKHAVVVRLKGGDPMLFGRAQEEIDALQAAGIQCEVVPGVTAALAASADLKISLTRRGMSRNVTFVTPRVGAGEDASDWIRSACDADTAVLYMAAGQSASIASTLIDHGLPADMPVLIVENASLPQMTTMATTLDALRSISERTTHGGPALLMIGRVFQRELDAQDAMSVDDAVRELLAIPLSA